jgi:hypothetical protein
MCHDEASDTYRHATVGRGGSRGNSLPQSLGKPLGGPRFNELRGFPTHLPEGSLGARYPRHRVGNRASVTRVKRKAVDPFLYEILGCTSSCRHQDRQPGRHCLVYDQAPLVDNRSVYECACQAVVGA